MPNSPMECGGQPEKLQPPPMGVAAAAAGGVCLRCSIKFHTGGHTGMWIRRAPQRRPYQARELSHANPGQIGIVRLDKILINPAGPRVHPGGEMAAWGRPGKHFRANQIPYTSRKVKFRAKLIKIEQNLKTLVLDFLTLVPT